MREMIKIAIIRQKYNPFGGAERFVQNAIQSLRSSQAVDITILTREWNDGEKSTKKILINPSYFGRLSRDYFFLRMACKHIQANDYDIVQSHEKIPCCDIYRAGDGVHKEWLRSWSRILTPWKRFIIKLSPYHNYLLYLEKRIFNDPNKRIIAISRLVKENIEKNYPSARASVYLIYNHVNLDRFQYKPLVRKNSEEAIKKIKLSTKKITLCFVGSGFERKGLITALQFVKKNKERIQLIVVGDDKKSSKYKRFSKKHGISHQVHFAGETKNPEFFHSISDFFILPTIYEPFSNAVLEAMASGLPPIITYQCGAKDLIKNYENGFLFDAFSYDGLDQIFNHITKLSEDELEKISLAAHNTARQYDSNRIEHELIRLYEKK